MINQHTNKKHKINAIYNDKSKILILGSFPSVKSLEQGFYYGHPQNRFWKVIAGVFNSPVPQSIEEKTEFLLKNNIALWDVIAECDIIGSSDTSIKNVVPNDITDILNKTEIKRIFINGKTAYKLYNKYILPKTDTKAVCLPSTSPANASYSLDRLISCWQIIK